MRTTFVVRGISFWFVHSDWWFRFKPESDSEPTQIIGPVLRSYVLSKSYIWNQLLYVANGINACVVSISKRQRVGPKIDNSVIVLVRLKIIHIQRTHILPKFAWYFYTWKQQFPHNLETRKRFRSVLKKWSVFWHLTLSFTNILCKQDKAWIGAICINTVIGGKSFSLMSIAPSPPPSMAVRI